MNDPRDLSAVTRNFYQSVLRALSASKTPFLVGGAFALQHYTRLVRVTKDLDVFVRRRDLRRALRGISALGYQTELAYPHWLAKVRWADECVDVIFNSGNGLTPVDDEWFRHASAGSVLDSDVLFCPAEETILSKAFIMERERFDGADVLHLLRARAEQLCWRRLVARFGDNWRVLLSHLVLFGFVYPDDRDKVPSGVMDGLLARLEGQRRQPAPRSGLCLGTLLSRAQYLVDIEEWGLRDARLEPSVEMTEADVELWTSAVPLEMKPGLERLDEPDAAGEPT